MKEHIKSHEYDFWDSPFGKITPDYTSMPYE